MATADRKVMSGLLNKMGVEVADGLTIERLSQRIVRKLTSSGAPADVTAEEKTLIEGLGFTIGTVSDGESGGAAVVVADPPAGTKAAYRLPGVAGAEDRIENITPEMAKVRNSNRKDDRRWVPDTSVGASKEPEQETPTKENDVKKTKTEKMTPERKNKKPLDPPKAKATPKATTAAATNAAAPKAEKAAKTPAEPKKPRSEGGAAFFKAQFEGADPVNKEKLLEKLVSKGVKPGTASSYIVWAKRPVSLGKTKNPFGFRIAETKDEKGVKFLTRTTKAK